MSEPLDSACAACGSPCIEAGSLGAYTLDRNGVDALCSTCALNVTQEKLRVTVARRKEALNYTGGWKPYKSAWPPEQNEYLCRTKGGERVVLSWDGIAWDHPTRSQRDWQHWNEVVEWWIEIPKGPWS